MESKIATSATFLAIIPDTATAIQIHGGGGMRVRFDIGEDQVGEALALTLMRDKLLKITVEAIDDKRHLDMSGLCAADMADIEADTL